MSNYRKGVRLLGNVYSCIIRGALSFVRKNNEILQLRSQKESQDLDTSSFAFSSSTSFLDTSTDVSSFFHQ